MKVNFYVEQGQATERHFVMAYTENGEYLGCEILPIGYQQNHIDAAIETIINRLRNNNQKQFIKSVKI